MEIQNRALIKPPGCLCRLDKALRVFSGVDQELVLVAVFLPTVENLEQSELVQIGTDLSTGVVKGRNNHF